MNIFALDESPKLAAQYHVDRHVIKMILETCQLLCTAHRIIDGEFFIGKTKSGRKIQRWAFNDDRDTFVYTATHINHPSAVWCRETYLHYCWLANLLTSLCKEYTYRYGKVHKCEQIGLVDWLVNNYPQKIDRSMSFRLPDLAMPDDCKIKTDVVTSYRKYYVNHKQRMHSWAGKVASRTPPAWLNDKSLVIQHA